MSISDQRRAGANRQDSPERRYPFPVRTNCAQFVWHKPGRNGLSVPTSVGMKTAAPAKLVRDKSAWFGSDGRRQQQKGEHGNDSSRVTGYISEQEM